MVKLTARISNEAHARLTAAAAADRRSVNSELEWLLTEALNARDMKDGEGKR